MSEDIDFKVIYDELTAAINEDSNNPDNFFRRGVLLYQFGNMDEAIADFDMAIELCRNVPDYYLYRGNAKNIIENYQGAINDYTFAIDLETDNDTVMHLYFNRGCAEYYLGNLLQASKDVNQSILLGLQSADSFDMQGCIEYESDNFEQAILSYTKAIELTPDNADLYQKRAKSKEKINDWVGAINDYKQALKIEPANEDITYNLDYAKEKLDEQNCYKEEINKILLKLRKTPDSDKLYIELGDLKYNNGDYENAIYDYTQAININSANVEAYSKRAYSNNWLNKIDDAIADYKNIIEQLPRDFEAYKNIANLLIQKNDYAQAVEMYNKAISSGVTSDEVYYFRAYAYLELKMYKEAQQDCAKCIKEKIGAYESLYEVYGDCSLEQKKYEEAIKYYQYAIDLYKKQEDSIMAPTYNAMTFGLLLKIEKVYFEQQKYNDALKIIEELIADVGEGVTYLLERGKIRLALEDFKGALDDFTSVINYDNENSEALELRDFAISKI